MKKRVFFLIIFFFISFFGFSKAYQSGVIKTKSGEEIHCDIDVYEYGIIITSSKIHYKLNGKKMKIKLSDIKAIALETNVYEVISYQKVVKTGPNRGVKKITLLAELIEPGEVTLYKTYVLQTSGGAMLNGMYTPTTTYLQANNYLVKNKKVKWVTGMDFKKSIRMNFPDCQILLDKIKKKELKFSDLQEAVIYGNTNCNIN